MLHTPRPLSIAALLTLALCGCAPSPTLTCVAEASLATSPHCDTPDAPTHKLPFRAGYKTEITQGFHGEETHHDLEAYALDFWCEEGDPIVASRAGVVLDARADSDEGCSRPGCAAPANFVTLDHGDGTISYYYHLRHGGALVRRGQQVCAGQVLGLCGATGLASSPHLHYMVTNLRRQSIPMRFEEIQGGFALPWSAHQSANTLDFDCAPTRYSWLPRDAFHHQGIVLEAPMPTAFFADDARTLRGTYRGDAPQVALFTRHVRDAPSQWHMTCATVDERGRFSLALDWGQRAQAPGAYWMMLSGADAQCNTPNWGWSYQVHLDPR